jgi:hypothetical protein
VNNSNRPRQRHLLPVAADFPHDAISAVSGVRRAVVVGIDACSGSASPWFARFSPRR